MNKIHTLYQLNSNNETKVWSIQCADMGDYSTITIKSGRQGGSLVVNEKKILAGKNIGRANETTHFIQAQSEAQSKVETKLKKGYVYNLSEAKNSAVLGSGISAPMLAQKYCWDGSQKGSKTLAEIGIEGKNIHVQPKLDGNRCLIKRENGNLFMYTRKGMKMPVQLTHILDNLAGLSDGCTLDGELFSDSFSFNVLNGIIKRETVTSEEREQRKLIKFHLYDVMLEAGYEDRFEFLQQFASDNVIIVPSYSIIASFENIEKYLQRFLNEGHEGLMIRQLGMGYDNKRSWQLCKVKVFEDAEFELIDFQEDVRGGFVGSFVMQDQSGNTFNAGASGQSVGKRTEMWNNKHEYIGKIATVEFFGLSEYGVPRFPKFKGVRN